MNENILIKLIKEAMIISGMNNEEAVEYLLESVKTILFSDEIIFPDTVDYLFDFILKSSIEKILFSDDRSKDEISKEDLFLDFKKDEFYKYLKKIEIDNEIIEHYNIEENFSYLMGCSITSGDKGYVKIYGLLSSVEIFDDEEVGVALSKKVYSFLMKEINFYKDVLKDSN